MDNPSGKLKILFLIHDLGQGGAEKVLVNLVNHLEHQDQNHSAFLCTVHTDRSHPRTTNCLCLNE